MTSTSTAPSLGAWLTLDSVFAAELMVRTGFDWAVIDLQHGALGTDAVVPLLSAVQGAGVEAWVRTQATNYAQANWALDMGADVVVVPQIGSAAQACEAVGFCRYAPEGHRSWGPVRAALRPASAPRQRVYLMIEDTNGLAEAEAICATPGLDGILIGTADLTLSLAGSASDVLGGATFDAVRTIVEACTRHGLDVAAYGGSQEMTTACAENGIRTVALAADYELLHEGAQAALALARGAFAAEGVRL
ncbi:aldolase/citrate lyase family protein [Rhodococcus sp. T2V]|uniref:HpcH/HpaI aldolase family protein n=1 Tax=Rhodococcus sp. T2V TaxID=3034164 RepID=UPI0023E2A4C5|nr:aldolase/citrate lyase family protein [Rhodococcus sp. T2V]MDF3305355.1 aldolase/citrate lyase family protein [Rhodococcus sp. T2V]